MNLRVEVAGLLASYRLVRAACGPGFEVKAAFARASRRRARVRVVVRQGGHCLEGDGALVDVANRFLEQVDVRCSSRATVQAYAFGLANFAGFRAARSLTLASAAETDLAHLAAARENGRSGFTSTERALHLTHGSLLAARQEAGVAMGADDELRVDFRRV